MKAFRSTKEVSFALRSQQGHAVDTHLSHPHCLVLVAGKDFAAPKDRQIGCARVNANPPARMLTPYLQIIPRYTSLHSRVAGRSPTQSLIMTVPPCQRQRRATLFQIHFKNGGISIGVNCGLWGLSPRRRRCP